MTVTDTGSGIAPEIVDRIFKPFFTTKNVRQGTGLGLIQVIGFAKQSGDDIRVDGVPGEGRTFTLPRAYSDDAGAAQDNDDESRVDGDGTCVLIVEDNEQVSRFATAALKELGYSTKLATGGHAALQALQASPEAF